MSKKPFAETSDASFVMKGSLANPSVQFAVMTLQGITLL
jgi:hypothetical protein